MKKRFLMSVKHLLAIAIFGTTLPLAAQDESLILQFDFEHVTGASVSDAAGSGATALLKNDATIQELGNYKVLNLGNGTGYLDMTSATGDLFRGCSSYTISMYYRVEETASLSGNGYFLWSFSTSSACGASDGKYSAYRLNAQRFANSTGGYKNETGIEIGGASQKGAWMHILYTQTGTKGSLYLNGKLMGSSSAMPSNTTNFTGSVPYAWIGRAPFSGDAYLTNTLVYNIQLYNKVLSEAEITKLAARTEELEDGSRYGTPGDFTALISALTDAEGFLSEENLSKYPTTAIEEYKDQIHVAQQLVDEGLVNQSIINEQITALNTAKSKLKKTAGFVLDMKNIQEGYDTDRGFKHPGALHTEADFNRIKQLLSAGNNTIRSAYNKLTDAAYSQSDVVSYPVETIVRGGGSGENYMNAARGASMAYQNALRWKIDGSTAHADRAVYILNQWTRTTKSIGGNSNYALAAGLYGYAFANAAELMRDYEGWQEEDFNAFKRWMLDVWYPSCISFLRGRNGTWENAGKWWQAPGHYWSNWGLCNVLAVMSIGILCDDVFIYNQGLSYYKYDQVGTFKDPRTANPILNDGLTEFLGNLVVTTATSNLETGAYGKLGQMQESGRDVGHAAMAAGLAVDIAHIGWNQGDDLFSYMDNRLAAGIEYIAAQMQGIEGLPWTNYHYGESGLHWSDSRTWIQTGPATGEQIRPYWGTVIGHYEGVKGVEMPFSSVAYEKMGIDGGGLPGDNSGGFDHMGYSVLMNAREGMATAENVPTLLTPQIQYNGTTLLHNELGGLTNTYKTDVNTGLPKGSIITLMPQLPAGEEDTGSWTWNTGETTKDITIAADKSYLYRATYTNKNGIKSEQVFSIAVENDCEESLITPHISYQGDETQTDHISVMYGSEVTLSITATGGYGTCLWENGQSGTSITLPNITTSRDIAVLYTNQGGRKHIKTFHIEVTSLRPDIMINGTTYTDCTEMIVAPGDDITLCPTTSHLQNYGVWNWDNGNEGRTLLIEDIQTSGKFTVTYTLGNDDVHTCTYHIYVKEPSYSLIETGNYYIYDYKRNMYLTCPTGEDVAFFSVLDENAPLKQQWLIQYKEGSTFHSFCSLSDSLYLRKTGKMYSSLSRQFRFTGAIGTDYYAISNSGSGAVYWTVDNNGTINFEGTETPQELFIELIPVMGNSIPGTTSIVETIRTEYFSLDGIRLEQPQKGINIRRTTFSDGSVKTGKIYRK